MSDEPGRDPFAPGAVDIAEPVLPTVPPAPRPLNLLVATIVICAAIVFSIGVFGRWTTRVAGYTAGGLAAATLLFDEMRGQRRESEVRAAATALFVMYVLALTGLVFVVGPAPIILGAAVFTVGALAWRSQTRASAAVRIAHEQRESLTVTYREALAWNGVREALGTPGAHVERNMGAPNFDEQLRVRGTDPATGDTAIRMLDEPLARDGWLVVDPDGNVIATAPPRARDSWLSATAPTWPRAS